MNRPAIVLALMIARRTRKVTTRRLDLNTFSTTTATTPQLGYMRLTPNGDEEAEVEKDSVVVSDHVYVKNGAHLGGEHDRLIPRDYTQETGRPSSADDLFQSWTTSPSVQVRKCILLDGTSAYTFHQGSLASPPIRLWTESYIIIAPIRSQIPSPLFFVFTTVTPSLLLSVLNIHSRQSSATYTIQDFEEINSPQTS